MKTKYFFPTLLSALFLFVLASCSDDDKEETLPKAPVIENIELGLDNSKVGYAGTDLHVEANIKAEAGLQSVYVQIVPTNDGSAWYVAENYTGTAVTDKQEYNLHRHYDIPEKAKLGTYDVMITAVDKSGQKTVYKDQIEIVKDPRLPIAKATAATYADGKLTVKADITAAAGLRSIEIKVKTISHSVQADKIKGKTEYSLNEELDVASLAAGHYHFFVTITDRDDKVFSYEGHFDKK